jgi:hypothetical protein
VYRAEAGTLVKCHIFSLVRSDIAEAERSLLQISFFRNDDLVCSDGPGNDALSQPPAGIDDNVAEIIPGDIDGLQDSRDPGIDDLLDDDSTARTRPDRSRVRSR